MKKGDETKQKILQTGFEMASKLGMECLSIGTLASSTGMSKSGLFSHFKSKENLQLAVMDHAGEIFFENVISPALKAPAGIQRLHSMMDRWINWTINLSGGCIFVAAAAEYSDRPGKMRDCIRNQHDQWIDCLSRVAQSAVKVGDLKEDTDCNLFAFEMYSLILGFFLYHNSIDYKGTLDLVLTAFERLLISYKP
ncbi:MAG: TetR/AcrR family transcriptional regulator [Desulfobacula sp.]|nr:TetR/AcrR family transcriptional regulator [Desulfobacula sp.]